MATLILFSASLQHAFVLPPASPPPALPPPSPPPALPRQARCRGDCIFFSEYLEAGPGSADTYLEIFNGCPTAMSLENYKLVLCREGCVLAVPGVGVPEGSVVVNLPNFMVAEHGTFVITYCEGQPGTASCADGNLVGRGDASYRDLGDGNEFIGLLFAPSLTFADQIGTVGEYNLDGWDVAGVASATRDHKLTRKPQVSRGNCGDWPQSAGIGESDSQWIVGPPTRPLDSVKEHFIN
eukprot:6192954-Pleurochrysis_carterae.AAC.1